jgi:hypothetical protein
MLPELRQWTEVALRCLEGGDYKSITVPLRQAFETECKVDDVNDWEGYGRRTWDTKVVQRLATPHAASVVYTDGRQVVYVRETRQLHFCKADSGPEPAVTLVPGDLLYESRLKRYFPREAPPESFL